MPRKRIFDLVIVAVLLLLLTAIAILRGSEKTAQNSVPSTYDTGTNGYAAAYELLAREGVRVERFRLPVAYLSRGAASTFVLAGDGAVDSAASSRSSRDVLLHWVASGGRLVVLDAHISSVMLRALGLSQPNRTREHRTALVGCALAPSLPGATAAGSFTQGYRSSCTSNRSTILSIAARAAGIALRHGRGTVALIATPAVFDNWHILQRDNARIAYAVFSGPGTVAFDERIHGYTQGRTFWEVLPGPVHAAIFIALAVALLAIAGANLPFAPPYEAQSPEERDSGAYIDSLAHMLQRGGAAHEAIARIADRCEHVLAPRAPGDERARMLLRELRTLQASPRPGSNEVVHAGRIFARVRKDYGC